MAKHLTHQKPGVYHVFEQVYFKLFTPDTHKTKTENKMVASLSPAPVKEKAKETVVELTAAPAAKNGTRAKNETTFNVADAYADYKKERAVEIDYTAMVPEIKLLHTGFSVAVSFHNKHNLAVKIYSRRAFEKEFKFLAIDTVSPYQDNRPKLDSILKEEREYKVVYFVDDKEVGNMSEIIAISI